MTEKLGGKRGGQVISGLIKNFSAAEKALREMEGAAGSADEEMQIIQDSIEYKINALKETWVGTIQELIDRGGLGELVSGLTKISEVLGKIVSIGGLSGSFGGILGMFAGFKNAGLFKTVTELSLSNDVSGELVATEKYVGLLGQRSIAQNNARVQTLYDVQQLELYAQACREGSATTEQLNAYLVGTSTEAQTYAVKMRAAGQSTGEYVSNFTSTMQRATTASKAFTYATKIASAALNAFIIGLAFTVISKVVSFINDQIHSSERLAESVKDLMSEYETAIDHAKSQTDTMKELIPVYEELSSGVDSLGRNIGLTEDEFEKYNKTVNQIADMFPAMVSGWTEEGNAIISLRGNVEELRDAYIEAEEAAYSMLTSSNADDIVKNYSNVINKSIKSSITDFGQRSYMLTKSNAVDALKKYISSNGRLENTGLSEDEILYLWDELISDNASLGINKILRQEKNLNNLTDKEFDYIIKYAKKKLKEYQSEIDSELKNVKSLANAFLVTDESYKGLDSNSKAALSKIINSISHEIASQWKTSVDVENYVRNLVESISDHPEVQKAISALFDLKISDMPIDEAKEVVDQYIDYIASVLNVDPLEIKVKLGFDYIDDLKLTADEIKKKAAQKYGKYRAEYSQGELRDIFDSDFAKEYDEFIKEQNINTTDELARLNKLIEKYGELNKVKYAYINGDEVSIVEQFSGFTDDETKLIDDFQSSISSLGSTLESLRNGEEINITDLIQEFPELAGQTDDLDRAITDLINGKLTELSEQLKDVLPSEVLQHLKEYTDQMTGLYPSIDKAYSSMHNIYEVMQTVKEEFNETTGIDKFTDSTLQSIAGINSHMNALVAAWHANGISSQELFDALKEEYQIDLENYGNALIAKYNDSETFYNAVGMMSAEVVNDFKDDYKVDLENCHTYNEAKKAIEIETLGKVSEIWGKYYNIQTKQLTSQAQAMKAVWDSMPEGIRTSVYNNSPVYKELVDSIAMMEEYQKDIEALNQLIYHGTDVNFEGVSARLNDAASSSKSEYKELFDFFERRIELIDQALSRLDSNLENVNGSLAKNILIAGKIDIVSKEIQDYTSALTMYEQKANEELSKLSSDLQDKIKNGAINLTTFIGENGEEVNNTLSEYQNWANKVNECNQKLIELKETLRDLSLDKFNNIVQDYNDQLDVYENGASLIDKQIALLQESGQLIGRGFYDAQISYQQNQISILERKKSDLVKSMADDIANGYIQQGTDEWLEMVSAINEVDGAILDAQKEVESLRNSILQIHDDTFERVTTQFSNISSDINAIMDLMEEADVSSEDGLWSDYGITQLGLYAQQYEINRKNVERYTEEISLLNDQYSKGEYSTTEYLEKLADLIDKQQESAKAAEDNRKEMIELNKARVEIIKQGIQKQIDKYKELTDAEKEALDKEKELHEYEKSIAEKNKNIQQLEEKIALLQNDTSLKARTERLRLEKELADAREDLEETQYDHSIDAQKEALDKNYEQFEEERQKEIDAWEEYLKDTDKVLSDSYDDIKKNTERISQTIIQIANRHGIQISEAITSAWESGENAIAGYGDVLDIYTSSFIANLTAIENEMFNMQEEANRTSTKYAEGYKNNVSSLINELVNAQNATENLSNAMGMLQQSIINTLEGGYNADSIIGSLKNVQEEAERTVQSIRNIPTGTSTSSGYDSLTPEQRREIDEAISQVPAIVWTNPSVWAEPTEEQRRDAVYNAEQERIANEAVAEQQRQAAEQQRIADQKRQEKAREIAEANTAISAYSRYWTAAGGYTSQYQNLSNAARNGDSYASSMKYTIDQAIRDYQNKIEDINRRYAGYASGVHNLKRSELAWTQELGHEAILSPTRNAILTKLNKGDTVLTKEQTDNLFKLSKINPADLFGGLKLSEIQRKSSPVLTIGNVLTVNGNVDDSNINVLKTIATDAVNTAFKKFSNEIVKR